jgi:hypothetical protein
MSTLVLAALLQLASGDIPIEQAEALARRDEATLQGEQASEFFDKQGKALGMALYKCGVTEVGEASGLRVVMRLDAQGRVTKTCLTSQVCWANVLRRSSNRPLFPQMGDRSSTRS